MKIEPIVNRSLSDRKIDHIELSMSSQLNHDFNDSRFYFEPINACHPSSSDLDPIIFLNKKMNFPWWFSSMTGGSHLSQKINYNMARAVGEFGLGMAVGSIRPLLEDRQSFDDFNLRPLLGNQPFWANLGIAQIEDALQKKSINKIEDILSKLDVDGLVIHINLLQEFYQQEGDRIKRPVIEILKDFLSNSTVPIIVKEVGQGMGPMSLLNLMKLKIAAIEFGAFGGTNFSLLENNRAVSKKEEGLVYVGHTASEMIEFIKEIQRTNDKLLCKDFIVSGGVRSMLDGLFYTAQLPKHSVFGQAQSILVYAQGEYNELREYIKKQIEYYLMAKNCLTPKQLGSAWKL